MIHLLCENFAPLHIVQQTPCGCEIKSSVSMEEEILAARLKALRPPIEAIRKTSGCPGASIGIARAGKVVQVEGFGYRDVERKLASDKFTIYYLASLSKTFTASMVGKLVEKGETVMDETPVSEILPQGPALG